MTITDAQIEARKKTIGGSDIGAILGENNYKTAYEVWEEKVEGKTTDLSRNKSVVIGQLLEAPLIALYESRYNKICTSAHTMFHKDYEFLSANLDAVAVQDSKDMFVNKNIVEIKTASVFNKDEWGPFGSQIVPKHYYAQIAHYMLVTGYKQADIFVGFVDESVTGEILCEINSSNKNGNMPDYSSIVEKMETRLYTFYRDEEIENLILESAKLFYNNYMKPWIEDGVKVPPPMDFSNKHFQDHLKNKYLISENSTIKLDDEFTKIKDKYLLAVTQSKIYDRIAQEEKSKILAAMSNNEKAILTDGSYFLRKTVKRKEYTVKESEYIKFEFKQPKESEMEDF
jgi:putative phage-type endonuclease